MRVVKIIAIGVVGFFLGYCLWRFNYDGYSQKWEILPAPPQEVSELIPTGEPPLFIKTSGGNTYYLSYQYNEGWLQATVPEDLMYPIEVTKPCDLWAPEFSPFSNALENINDCVQERTMYGDGSVKSTFIIDSNGNIWRWQHIVTAEDLLPLLCFPFLGLSAGLLAGFVFVRRKNAKQKE